MLREKALAAVESKGSLPERLLQRLRRMLGGKRGVGFLADRPDLRGYKIGAWSYGDLDVVAFNRNGGLEIGRYCSFARGVTIVLGGEHNTRFVSTYPFGVFLDLPDRYAHERTKGDVVIGHDVWVGRSATILSGVSIGSGAVIGAHSLVTKDVPPYAIVSGNPASVVRSRFEPELVAALLQLQWWHWPDEKVLAEVSSLMDPDVAAFVSRHQP